MRNHPVIVPSNTTALQEGDTTSHLNLVRKALRTNVVHQVQTLRFKLKWKCFNIKLAKRAEKRDLQLLETALHSVRGLVNVYKHNLSGYIEYVVGHSLRNLTAWVSVSIDFTESS